MSPRLRVAALAAVAGCLVAGASACGTKAENGSGSLGTPSIVAVSSPATSPSTPATTAPPTTAPASVAPAIPAALTCSQIKFAQVGSATISYNGYHDSIPLGGGVWSGEDGNTVTLQTQCAIGDLDGDGAKDAVGVVTLSSGGTGTFYTLVVWRNVNHKPVFWALSDLDDRTPVESISISGHVAIVVYDTRTPDASMIEHNIKRTAIYKLSSHHFTETSHTDESI